MAKDYSKQNLQRASLRNEDLREANFSGSDLRGADLSNSDLTAANLTSAKTGITPGNKIWIFIGALVVSLVSGYFAMLAGKTIQGMLASPDNNVKNAGIISIVIIVAFILFAIWKGGRNAINYLIIPAIGIAALLGGIFYLTGAGTGRGMLFLIVALILTVTMFVVGTIARATAGTLSNILFLIVAVSGGMFGKSLGGGIGTVVMAIACVQISKKALSGNKNFKSLRKLAFFITRRFGTSFRNARLNNADFTGTTIHNSDFTNADISTVKWDNTKKLNCIINENGLTVVKE